MTPHPLSEINLPHAELILSHDEMTLHPLAQMTLSHHELDLSHHGMTPSRDELIPSPDELTLRPDKITYRQKLHLYLTVINPRGMARLTIRKKISFAYAGISLN